MPEKHVKHVHTQIAPTSKFLEHKTSWQYQAGYPISFQMKVMEMGSQCITLHTTLVRNSKLKHEILHTEHGLH